MATEPILPQFALPKGIERIWAPVGRADRVTPRPDGVDVRAGSATIAVTALASGIFRVGIFADGRPAVFPSEAVAKTAWPAIEARVERSDDGVAIRTAAATAHVGLDPVCIGFADSQGNRFGEDEPTMRMGHMVLPSDAAVPDPLGPPTRLHKRRPPAERYFGCGERTGGLEKTGSRQVFWNSDPPHQHTSSLNNLYTSIPFVLALESGRAWGLFVDNAGRVEIDLASKRVDVLSAATDHGDLVYYVFAGPTPRLVLERYTELTGRMPMPPLWALGNHQSRWGYKSEEEIRTLARRFREHDIPCDALYLDIDYMDGFRVFTWDKARFPEPKKLTGDLAAEGFHVVAIVDPGLKVDDRYDAYVSGRDRDFFCKTIAGEEYHNVVWPGVCAFPDFTNPEARSWWGEWLSRLVDEGIAGIWCDMNEPAMFVPSPSTMPDNVVHPGGDRARLHAEVHNAYGSLMARATRDGLLRLRPDERPFVISRAGYAGLQRHALHWTGDNSSWWEHVAMCLPQIQNLGLSGLAWVGVDVGGFWGDSSGELLARWTEAAAFFPFYRNHCARDARPQEPWEFGEPWLSHIRAMLGLRQRLLPYLYALFDEAHRTGAPIVRPLLFEYPDDDTTYGVDDQFLLGRALMVAPLTRPTIEHRAVYLPRGTWCDWWTGERTEGPAHVLARAPVGRPAIWARANVAIPLWPPMRYVGERPPDPLTLVLYVGEGVDEITLYEDRGDGWEHERGHHARRTVRCETSGDRVAVEIGRRDGTYVPARAELHVELHGLRDRPREVRVDGRVHGGTLWDRGVALVAVPERAGATVVQVELGP